MGAFQAAVRGARVEPESLSRASSAGRRRRIRGTDAAARPDGCDVMGYSPSLAAMLQDGSMSESWTAVDAYLNGVLLPDDPSGQAALDANAAAGLPAIDVTPARASCCSCWCTIGGARRVLEIGTLGGYSTLWISRG